jgi:phosphopantothenoylcysteine decarboxylase/phosphopantothenate--cysteine ligase
MGQQNDRSYPQKYSKGGVAMLQGKTVLLGVSGSIAAYKTASLASALKKKNCEVHVLMTANASRFITPLTFETLTGQRCLVDTFDRQFEFNVAHVALAQRADLILIAPASADILAKLAHGIADDMLTTTVLAARCPKLAAPTMNTAMYENPITQDNLRRLGKAGFELIEPASGRLACDDVGRGKMPEPEELEEYILRRLAMPHDMEGQRVLVTAGPTQEALDPVRFLSNHSSGRMGYALARACAWRGADVTLVSGPSALTPPRFVEIVPVTSAAEMYDAVMERFPDCDFVFKAAAVADYTPAAPHDEKIKKRDDDLSVPLQRTRDILAALGQQKRPDQFVCGFSMETQNLLANSRAKLEAKNVDMIVANSLRTAGAGFGADTNIVTLLTADGAEELPKMSKLEVAGAILDRAVKLRAAAKQAP